MVHTFSESLLPISHPVARAALLRKYAANKERGAAYPLDAIKASMWTSVILVP